MNRALKVLMAGGLVGLAGLAVRAQQPQVDMEQLTKAMQALSGAQAGQTPVAVVDFRELKALLPESLDGFKRTNASGEKNTTMGITLSQANATYEATDGGNVTIKISDNGGMGGLMAFAQAAWASSEIDRETDTGFERTATYKGHKTHEEYDREERSGKIDAIIGGRFNVEIQGYQVAWESLQAALGQLDMDKLAGLKPAAP